MDARKKKKERSKIGTRKMDRKPGNAKNTYFTDFPKADLETKLKLK